METTQVDRSRLPDAIDGPLVFAQVREDPLLEIEALQPGPTDTVMVVSSGGCTALSLLAAGAGRVVAVDLSSTQNHLLELKRAAVAHLGARGATAFLGGFPASASDRESRYRVVAPSLTEPARSWWDSHPGALRKGALGAGRSERFVGLVGWAIRHLVQSPAKVDRLLGAGTLAEQRQAFDDEWDTRRWRALFSILLNRAALRRAYDPSFFSNVESPSFARHFRDSAARTLTEIPVATNYFVSHVLTGRYPAGALPPYLQADGWAADPGRRLDVVDGSATAWLRRQPDHSVDAYALSNIAEWLGPAGVDQLFAEVARTARPGARLVFRNFVGWTEVPRRWRHVIREDRASGEALIRRDRSGVQRRIAVCRVHAHEGAAT